MGPTTKSESGAVKVARANIEAWSKHDYESVRASIAAGVTVKVSTTQPNMPPTDTAGIDRYMEGLIRFAQFVEFGSTRILASIGDEHNALIMLTSRATLGPDKPAVDLAAARLYQVDEKGKINAEQVIFFSTQLQKDPVQSS